MMDTSKAFDVVSHVSMLSALHQQGIGGTLWRVFDSMYTNVMAVVKWKGTSSKPFPEMQGIRHGGIISNNKYKAGKNLLLSRLDTQCSNTLGSVNVGSTMVADDLILAATNRFDM